MKKFQCQSRRTNKSLLVFVLLVCSIQFVTFVLEVEGDFFALRKPAPDTGVLNDSTTLPSIESNTPLGTTIATYTGIFNGSCSSGTRIKAAVGAVTRNGVSAPAKDLTKYFGFEADATTVSLKTKKVQYLQVSTS